MKKKFVLFYLFFLSTLLLYSQNEQEEHLTFKNVPITGHVDSFIKEMTSLGYSFVSKEEKFVIMKGKFGDQNVKLKINNSLESKTVYSVEVIFKQEESWYDLEHTYNQYKDALIKKYGNPKFSYEFFSDSKYEDGEEMLGVKMGKCSYITLIVYKENGIGIHITEDQCVMITYSDRKNVAISELERVKTINEDI